MRLIDVDALIEKHCENCKEEIRNSCKTDPICATLMWFEEAPTIDPESLRPQGEWIDKPTGAYRRWQSWCSHCGKHSGIGGIESNRHKSYCPNCGAKMKGGADDAD